MTPLTNDLHRSAPNPSRSRAALVSDAVTAAYIRELSQPASAPPSRRVHPRVLAGPRRRPGSVAPDHRRGPRRPGAARRSGVLALQGS